MSRLRQVSRAEATPEVAALYGDLFGDRDPVANPGTATGTPGNWWTTFALVPAILAHAQAGFALFNAKDRALTPYQRELAIVRAGFAAGSEFVYSQHMKVARRAGVPEEKLRDLHAWPSSPAFDDADRALLAYVDALVLEHGRVQGVAFARLRTHLTDEAILELTYVAATYAMHAAVSRALRLEYDDIDERVVEIPAPQT
jgi:alkylhydroperoxidase family enzyme